MVETLGLGGYILDRQKPSKLDIHSWGRRPVSFDQEYTGKDSFSHGIRRSWLVDGGSTSLILGNTRYESRYGKYSA